MSQDLFISHCGTEQQVSTWLPLRVRTASWAERGSPARSASVPLDDRASLAAIYPTKPYDIKGWLQGGESETELVVSSTAQGPSNNMIKISLVPSPLGTRLDKDRRAAHWLWQQRQLKIIDCWHCRIDTTWRGLACSCIGVHGTVRLSLSLLGSVSDSGVWFYG